VADTNGGQFSERKPERKSVQMFGQSSQRICDVANAKESGLEGWNIQGASHMEGRFGEGCGTVQTNWLPEPNVGRVAHGIPNRVAKLRGLGNAIVPQVAAELIRCIVEVSK
jgi:hypothetical protein